MDELPNLPAMRTLQALRQWLCWRWAERDGRKTKIPMSPHNGLGASVTNPAHWGSYDQAMAQARRRHHDGVGFVLTEDDGLTGVDLDHCRDPKTGQFAPWAQEVLSLGETYAELSVSGTGVHLFWLGKVEKTFKANGAGTEVYRSARYLIITGHHLRDTPKEIKEAPRTLALLRARVEATRVKPEPVKKVCGNAGDYFRTVNTAALACLALWVPILHPQARHYPGTGAWRVTSKDLGRDLQEDLSYAPTGIWDFGLEKACTAIDSVMTWGNAADVRQASFWLCARMGRTPASLGWDDGSAATAKGAELAKGILAHKKDQRPDDSTQKLAALIPAAADWTRPQGLLGDIATWIIASSRRPNRPLAVAAAVAVLSTVCGRHLYGPTGTSLNLYIVALAGTGVGKNRPLDAVGELLREAGLGRIHTGAKAFSVSAVEKMIYDYPCCVATSDEIGGNLLGRMSHKHANTHETSMRTTLMELWSREQGMGPFIGTRRATTDPVTVPSPSLTLYGVSTPEAFYRAVTTGSVKDGFLNRFLLAPAAPRAKARDPGEEARKVPGALCMALATLVPRLEGDLSLIGVYSLAHQPAGVRLTWAGDHVRVAAEGFEDEILGVADANIETAPLLGRVFETAVRLASLHAVSRGGVEAKVGGEDLTWGKAWALQSAQAMIEGTQYLMAENDYEEKFNHVRNVIREAGAVTRQALLRVVRSISARERDDIVTHLVEGGWIEVIQVAGKGRTAQGWRWLGNETVEGDD
jgi:hypothetical protein